MSSDQLKEATKKKRPLEFEREERIRRNHRKMGVGSPADKGEAKEWIGKKWILWCLLRFSETKYWSFVPYPPLQHPDIWIRLLCFKNSIPNQPNQENKTKTPKRKFQTHKGKRPKRKFQRQRENQNKNTQVSPNSQVPKDSNQNPDEEQLRNDDFSSHQMKNTGKWRSLLGQSS